MKTLKAEGVIVSVFESEAVVSGTAHLSAPQISGLTRAQAAGTTSTTYTVAAPASTGSGGLSYTRSLSHDSGSGASVSGGDTGTQTVSNLEDQDCVTIRHTVTDSEGTQAYADVTIRVDRASGSAAWTPSFDLNLKNVTTTADLTSGTHTLTVGSDSIDVTVARIGSSTGIVRGENGSGVLVDGVNTANSINAAFDIDGLFVSWGIANLTLGPFAVEITLESIDIGNTFNDGWMALLNSSVSHNSGFARGIRVSSLSGGTTERVSTRSNGSDTTRISSQSVTSSVVVTLTTWKGTGVDAQFTPGTAPPTPFTGTVYSAGSPTLSHTDPVPYESTLYAVLNATSGGSFYVTRIRTIPWE